MSKIKEIECKNNSNIVLALDLVSDESTFLLSKSAEILDKVHPYICALKINHHLTLPLGLFNGVKKIIEKAHKSRLPVIMDCKINDIGSTNRIIAVNYFKAGFDAVIANPFVGWEEGLQAVFDVAEQMERGVLLLVYMSHKASGEGYGQNVYDPSTKSTKPQYVIFAEKALSWGADGVIVGATAPDKIREVYAILKDKVPIYSPGIGVQGGNLEAAMSSGASYLIVGRSIIYAEKPDEAARTFRDLAAKFLRQRWSGGP
jgi:orotidine-5'-phosphate decarboxylase